MLREKLGSITDHCANIHSFPDNAEHKCCAHLPLGPDEDRSKGWLDPDSLVFAPFVAYHGGGERVCRNKISRLDTV